VRNALAVLKLADETHGAYPIDRGIIECDCHLIDSLQSVAVALVYESAYTPHYEAACADQPCAAPQGRTYAPRHADAGQTDRWLGNAHWPTVTRSPKCNISSRERDVRRVNVWASVGVAVFGAVASVVAGWYVPSKMKTGTIVVIVVSTLCGLIYFTVLKDATSDDQQSSKNADTETSKDAKPSSPESISPPVKIDNTGGWGPERPTFTEKKPAPYAVFNSITDNSIWGDERQFIACKDKARLDDPTVSRLVAEDGHSYVCHVDVNNDVAANLDNGNSASWLHDARLTILLPSESIYNPGVQATLTASNAQPVWASCNFLSAQPMRLIYVYGSARMYTNATSNDGLQLAEDVRDNVMHSGLLVSPGSLLGYDKQDGIVRYSYRYTVIVWFEFKVLLDPGD
jgi:hypothetical protein